MRRVILPLLLLSLLASTASARPHLPRKASKGAVKAGRGVGHVLGLPVRAVKRVLGGCGE